MKIAPVFDEMPHRVPRPLALDELLHVIDAGDAGCA